MLRPPFSRLKEPKMNFFRNLAARFKTPSVTARMGLAFAIGVLVGSLLF